MSSEWMAMLWSYLYVVAIVGLGEGALRVGLARSVARKIIHVGVGFWVFGTLALFSHAYMAAIPPLTAAVGNYVIHRKRLLKSVEAEPENLGTVWFPISFALLILCAWDVPGAVAGGVMAMTVGDAVAALVGERWGRHRYRTLGERQKSLEGSLAMLLASFVALLLSVAVGGALTGVISFSGWFLPALAALAAVAATCAEGLGIQGRDNLWVPLTAGAVVYAGYVWLTPDQVLGLGLGAVLALLIGLAAWLRGSLTPSGVLGAVLTGSLVFGFGGWAPGLALVGFFVSSSLISRLFRRRKAEVERDYAKSGARDIGQALANGGVAALACAAYGLTGSAAWLAAALGAIAVANADTWATELGVLSLATPRLITTFRAAPAGSSGAVSAVGTLASVAGALLVSALAALVETRWLTALWALTLAGLAGSLLDSILGATVQGVYRCPACGRETERQVHGCGSATEWVRGWPWLGNDLVNLLSTVVGAAIGFWLG